MKSERVRVTEEVEEVVRVVRREVGGLDGDGVGCGVMVTGSVSR